MQKQYTAYHACFLEEPAAEEAAPADPLQKAPTGLAGTDGHRTFPAEDTEPAMFMYVSM